MYYKNKKQLLIALKGDTGAKIVSTELIGQDENGGNIYKQTFDDGTTATFTAPKGADGAGGGANITVDSELSNESENPVQNKVVTEALLKNISNVTIIDQDLSKADFVPTPNTYYRHINRYNTKYDNGTILFYNGTDYEIVEVLNSFVSKWESVVGGHTTILTRGTNGKYSNTGLGNGVVTIAGFVPTYTQRTDANGVKSTVLVTGNPVNDVDATPKKWVEGRTGIDANTLYRHHFYATLSNGWLFEFDIYSNKSEIPIVDGYLQLTLDLNEASNGLPKSAFNCHCIFGGNSGVVNPPIEFNHIGFVEGSDPILTLCRITKIGHIDFSTIRDLTLAAVSGV